MENFKKHKGGPTPIRPAGSQDWAKGKTTTTKPTKHPHGQDPAERKRPAGHGAVGVNDRFSPPVTPHRVGRSAGLMSPVSQYGALRGNPSPNAGHIRTRHMGAEPVLPKGSQEWSGKVGGGMKGSQSHTTVQGARKATTGGQQLRTYGGAGEGGPASVDAKSTSQAHTRARAIAPRLHVGMTKDIKGLIGKRTKRRGY